MELNKIIPIKGWEGLYEMFYDGIELTVFSIERNHIKFNKKYKKEYIFTLKRKIIKPNLAKIGYLTVCLHREKKGHTTLVHRLIGLHYLPIDPKRNCINHKDGIKTNNCIENLEWVTKAENTKHAYDNNLNQSGKLNKLLRKEIAELLRCGESAKFLSEKYKVSTTTIHKQRKLIIQ